MDHAPYPVSRPRMLVIVALAGCLHPGSAVCRAQGTAPDEARADEDPPAPRAERSNQPWRASGRVTDPDGRPLPGVEVWAHCGMGTLRRTGLATSDAVGRYELDFGPGILLLRGEATPQAATITAHKPGCFEENLNRQGDCLAAGAMPDEEALQGWGGRKDRLFLPGKPLELDFVMRPAGRVAGTLVDEPGRPLAGYSIALTGAEMPPSSSVVRSTYADERGHFALEDIPTTYRYQFVVRKADPRPPWDDSWASAALRFERPERGELHAWFGQREIRVEELRLRVAGPGVHGRTATPIAGNAGVLELAAEDPADVLERSDERLDARAATLTLRNAPRPDVGRSPIPESVPAASAIESKTGLARTRPDEAGEFTISFENPRGFDLEPGEHQVIFQVFVGVSEDPIRGRIFRQLEIRDGRYEVPVTIPPGSIEDSRVSITFVSIQPEHDAWVKAFFREGKGTGYSGLWTSDGGLLPAIPYASPGAE